MNYPDLAWKFIHEYMENIVDYALEDNPDADEVEDIIIEKLYELKNHVKNYITTSTQ